MGIDLHLIGIIQLFAVIFIARFINEIGIKKLSVEKKGELVEIFSKDRIINLVIAVGLLAFFFGGMYFELLDKTLLFWLFYGLLIVMSVFGMLRAYQKLTDNAFPQKFIYTYLISSALRFVSLLVFIFMINYQYFN